jgi:hypothetical protein
MQTIYTHVTPGMVIDCCIRTRTRTSKADKFFGESATRLVREFREIGPDGYFIGQKLEAPKRAAFRWTLRISIGRQQIYKFHKSFCDTQERAQRLVQVFNDRLEMVPDFDPETTPKISFLEWSLCIITDKNRREIGMLVEKHLDPQNYKKWNDNCGAADKQNPHKIEADSDMLHVPLDMIAEYDEEREEESEDEYEEEETDETFCVADIPQTETSCVRSPRSALYYFTSTQLSTSSRIVNRNISLGVLIGDIQAEITFFALTSVVLFAE